MSAIGHLFGSGGSPSPPPLAPAVTVQGITPETPPAPNSLSVQNAALEAAQRLGAGYGQQQTVLTSGLGAPGVAPVRRKVLLGG